MTSVTLSAKELECLQAVMAEMDDIPSVSLVLLSQFCRKLYRHLSIILFISSFPHQHQYATHPQ